MFKKILQEIGELRKQIDGLYNAITKRSYMLNHYEEEIDNSEIQEEIEEEMNQQAYDEEDLAQEDSESNEDYSEEV